MRKVFGIGFHKTGTTSLAQALTLMGYRVTGPNGVRDENIAEHVYDMVDTLLERHDAFQDNPWPVMYRYVDARCPRSKFVLTIRPSDRWIASQVRHFGTDETPMRAWIYGVGCPLGNESTYVRRYERHNAEVLEYFRDRPDDLLVMDLGSGDGWEKLCAFLDHAIPNVEFPRANRAEDREAKALRRGRQGVRGWLHRRLSA